MNWIAVLLSAAALGGQPATEVKAPTAKQQCVAKAKAKAKTRAKAKQLVKKCKKAPKAKAKPRQTPTAGAPVGDAPAPQPSPGESPAATPTPAPGAPTPTPTPTPGPVYPSRTSVDLVEIPEWAVKPSYRTLAKGTIDFNVNNLGEDDHNLSVRRAGTEYGRLDLGPGESDTLTLTLNTPGTYTLYCSLLGHEDAGMRSTVSVR